MRDITGKRSGRVVAVRFDKYHQFPCGKRQARWIVKCDCGESFSCLARSLNGHTRSCGCLESETTAKRNTTHSMSDTPEYRTWANVCERTECKGASSYAYYGGRGIKMCARWRESFEAFYADMGPRPSPKHSLDRIDVNGDYAPENCRWVTHKEQMRNMRRNRMITFRGETKCVAAFAEQYGLTLTRATARLHRGWSVERTFTTPQNPRAAASATSPGPES